MSTRRRLLLSPLLLLVALATVLTAGTVSASAGHGPQTRVRAFDTTTANAVGQQSSETAGSVGCLRPSQPAIASGSCVATKAAPFGEIGPAGNPGSLRTVIGKTGDLEAPGAIGSGERTLLDRLPDQGSPAANWAQNDGVLRQEMGRGMPIRDASVNPVTGALETNTGFLRAERNLLDSRGWTYDPKTTMWYPPG